MFKRIITGIVALAFAQPASAFVLDDVKIEWWAGIGPNQVLLIIDFWPGDGEQNSFAFGYRFAAAQITGLELLQGVQAAGQGFSFDASVGYVTDIWYVKAGQAWHATDAWPDSWLSYWQSPDLGQSWEFSPVGAAQRVLVDGDSDGWLAKSGDDETSQPVTPRTLGDLNCDGALDAFDIDPFVLALTDPAAYEEQFPECRLARADVNGDGAVDAFDIDPFVARLTGP
jgi:hypothetical protein